MIIARTVRDALREAAAQGCYLEALANTAMKSREAAVRRLPKKRGMLVKHDDGTFVPLRLVKREGAV